MCPLADKPNKLIFNKITIVIVFKLQPLPGMRYYLPFHKKMKLHYISGIFNISIMRKESCKKIHWEDRLKVPEDWSCFSVSRHIYLHDKHEKIPVWRVHFEGQQYFMLLPKDMKLYGMPRNENGICWRYGNSSTGTYHLDYTASPKGLANPYVWYVVFSKKERKRQQWLLFLLFLSTQIEKEMVGDDMNHAIAQKEWIHSQIRELLSPAVQLPLIKKAVVGMRGGMQYMWRDRSNLKNLSSFNYVRHEKGEDTVGIYLKSEPLHVSGYELFWTKIHSDPTLLQDWLTNAKDAEKQAHDLAKQSPPDQSKQDRHVHTVDTLYLPECRFW